MPLSSLPYSSAHKIPILWRTLLMTGNAFSCVCPFKVQSLKSSLDLIIFYRETNISPHVSVSFGVSSHLLACDNLAALPNSAGGWGLHRTLWSFLWCRQRRNGWVLTSFLEAFLATGDRSVWLICILFPNLFHFKDDSTLNRRQWLLFFSFFLLCFERLMG